MISNKWIISNAKQVLLNSPHTWQSSSFKVKDVSDYCYLHLHWDRNTPDKIQPAKLRICLEAYQSSYSTSTLVVSNCILSIVDCLSHRIIAAKDKYVEIKYQQKSYLIEDSFYIGENEQIDSIFGTGSTLSIQIQADFTFAKASSMSALQPSVETGHDFSKRMYEMYKDQSLTDVAIVAGNKTFHAHRIVLASQSDVFKKMFECDMREREHGIVDISDIAPETVEELLTYFYTGSIQKFAKDLLVVADKYNLAHLSALCQDKLKMKLTIDNCASVLLLAEKVHLDSKSVLVEACIKFINQHSTAVEQSSSWTECFESLSQDLQSKLSVSKKSH